jgi:hypothetical protein
MIWGEIINATRRLHQDFLDYSHTPLKTFIQDQTLPSSAGFPFPEAAIDYADWEPVEFANSEIQEALELHPVERVLLEGPILPIQMVSMNAKLLDNIYLRILKLETEWCQSVQLDTDLNFQFIEQTFAKRWLKVRTKAGFNSLKAVSS